MRIGILTFHNAINYGAVLQAYATQELLRSMGHEVEVIDYHNWKIDAYYKKYEFSWRKFLSLNPKRIIKACVVPRLYCRRRERYSEFLSKLNLSPTIREGDALLSYDAVLIGSDQVWSIKHTGGFDAMYWGNFPVSSDAKRIAWSVCMGDAGTRLNVETVANNLQNFSAISVREFSLKDYLNTISDMPVTVTLDPTLIASREIWKSYLHPVKEQNFIMVYAVKSIPETIAIANKIGCRKEQKVIVISAYSGNSFGYNVKQTCGPQDFLSYIYHASMIVTSSFHGTVFSILFRKEFVSVIPDGKSNVRVSDLLSDLSLTNRIVKSPDGINKCPSIDYKKVYSQLDRNKQKSIEFLLKALN